MKVEHKIETPYSTDLIEAGALLRYIPVIVRGKYYETISIFHSKVNRRERLWIVCGEIKESTMKYVQQGGYNFIDIGNDISIPEYCDISTTLNCYPCHEASVVHESNFHLMLSISATPKYIEHTVNAPQKKTPV